MFNNKQSSDLSRLQVQVCTMDTSAMINSRLIELLNDACDKVEDAGSNGALLLRLTDNEQHHEAEQEDLDVYRVSKWEKALRRVELLRAPVFCAAEGRVHGQGLAVMLTTDYRFIEPQCQLSLSCHKGEIMPGTAIQRLVHQVGSGNARRLTLFGAQIEALNAQTCGLVDEVVEQAFDRAERRLAELDIKRTADIAVRRQLLLEANAMTYEQALGGYLPACDRSLRKAVQGEVA